MDNPVENVRYCNSWEIFWMLQFDTQMTQDTGAPSGKAWAIFLFDNGLQMGEPSRASADRADGNR